MTKYTNSCLLYVETKYLLHMLLSFYKLFKQHFLIFVTLLLRQNFQESIYNIHTCNGV